MGRNTGMSFGRCNGYGVGIYFGGVAERTAVTLDVGRDVFKRNAEVAGALCVCMLGGTMAANVSDFSVVDL